MRAAAIATCCAALLGIVGCDGDPPVAYDVTELGTSEGEASLVVEVPQAYTKPQLREVFDKVRAENSEPDQGVFVAIKCQTGNHEAGADHLAHGRYAVGEVGRRYTGLAPGQADFTVLEGRTCAPRSPEEEARANSPAQRADAYALESSRGIRGDCDGALPDREAARTPSCIYVAARGGCLYALSRSGSDSPRALRARFSARRLRDVYDSARRDCSD